MRISTLHELYPMFENIFYQHVKNAKFYGVAMKSQAFRNLKMGVISLWRLQRKHKHIHPEIRSRLIQALLIEHDFQRAFELTQKMASILSPSRWWWPDPNGGEKLKHRMRSAAADISDSDFLQQLESTNDEDLRSATQNAKPLAQTELSSSIDTIVQTMTHEVLGMQQDLCGRQVQLQVEYEEREVLKNAFVDFIREINKKSVKGQNS